MVVSDHKSYGIIQEPAGSLNTELEQEKVNDPADCKGPYYLKLSGMIDTNEAPNEKIQTILLAMESQQIARLRKKLRDAIRNNKPSIGLKRAKKWSFEDRKTCLQQWSEALDPKAIVKLRRSELAKGSIIKAVDQVEEGDDGQNSLTRMVQLITGPGLPSETIAQFKQLIGIMTSFPLDYIENTWKEGVND